MFRVRRFSIRRWMIAGGLLLAAAVATWAPWRLDAQKPQTDAVSDRVENPIAKEPKYASSPRYALLVFGDNADSRAWLVEDGDALYVDKNGNADLTDDGPPLAFDAGQRRYTLNEIAPAGSAKHTDFCLRRWKSAGEKENSYGLSVTVDGHIPMYAGWFGTFWAKTPQAAKAVRFGGPMEPTLVRFEEVGLDSKTKRLSIALTTPGPWTAALVYLSNEAIPASVVPLIRIDWPVAEGAQPVQTSHKLTERCCYWEFYDSHFNIPKGITVGTAKATISLPGGQFPVQLTTNQIEFPVREKDSGKDDD